MAAEAEGVSAAISRTAQYSEERNEPEVAATVYVRRAARNRLAMVHLQEDVFQAERFDVDRGVPGGAKVLDQAVAHASRRPPRRCGRRLPCAGRRERRKLGQVPRGGDVQPFDALLEHVQLVVKDDAAVAEDGHAVGHPLQVAGDVRGKEDRAGLALGDVQERAEEVAAGDRIERGDRLVEHQQFRLVPQGQHDGKLLELPGRKRSDAVLRRQFPLANQTDAPGPNSIADRTRPCTGASARRASTSKG